MLFTLWSATKGEGEDHADDNEDGHNDPDPLDDCFCALMEKHSNALAGWRLLASAKITLL